MYRVIRRLINWTGMYKKRIYVGFVYAFIHSIFTAFPIILASYGIGLVLDDFKGVTPLKNSAIWILFIAMILSVLGRFAFSYLRATTQESVGCEATAEQRIRLGNILKRVSLGFFNHNNIGELSAATTTDLSFIEMYSTNMIDTVVNGHITVVVMILFLLFYCPLAGIISLTGVFLATLIMRLLERISHRNAPLHQKAQDELVENTIEYLRGMQVIKSFKQEGVAIDGIQTAYQTSKKVNIKIELEYCPYNCLHQFVLKAASIGIVAVSSYLTLIGNMEIPTMLMMDMFSFVIFNQLELVNSAIHVIEIINSTLDKLDKIENAEIIDKGKSVAVYS